MSILRFLRKNKIYDTVPREVFQFSKALCALIGVTMPNAILIDNEIPDGECAVYDSRVDIIFIKKGYRDGKLSVIDSMPYAIACGLNEKRYYLRPEEREKDKKVLDTIYKIAAETENKDERMRRIHDAIFPHCEK